MVTATYIKQGRKKENTEPTSRLMDSPMQESGITKYKIQEEETNESLPICDTRRKEHHYQQLSDY